MASLREWRMNDDLISRSIPSLLSSLRRLEVIDWAGNSLSGRFPSSFAASLRNLEHLDLSSNFFTGPIPELTRNWVGLKYLNLKENDFGALFSNSISSWSYLEELLLAGNSKLVIPSEVGLLQKLEVLDINNVFPITTENPFLPSVLQNLTALTSLRFDAFADEPMDWIGSLPDLRELVGAGQNANFTALSKLELLQWRSRPLSNEIGELTNLRELRLYVTPLVSFGSVIFNEIERLTSLTTLELSIQGLEALPSEISRLTLLEELGISGISRLRGAFSSILFSLTNLQHLNLGRNSLSGQISSSIGTLTALTHLDLGENAQISGSIPSELSVCTGLGFLDLSNNTLTGTLGTQIGRLTALTTLDLRLNKIEGSLPSATGLLSGLRLLQLGENDITGTLPSQLGQLTLVNQFRASNNSINGTIPLEFFESLGVLSSLDLSHNAITGTVPETLSNLRALSSLRLNANLISGTIPEKTGSLLSLASLNLTGNALTGRVPEALCSQLREVRGCLDVDSTIVNCDPEVASCRFFTTYFACRGCSEDSSLFDDGLGRV